MKKSFLLLLLFLPLLIIGCSKDTPSGPAADDYDREAILINWADNLIIPAFENMQAATSDLHAQAQAFTNQPDTFRLDSLRDSWKQAYLAFQQVSMFEMGKAMELYYRDNLNIYPTDTTEIHQNIQSGSYNLMLPSLNNSQGFPALDYMVNGLGANDADILNYYTIHQNSSNYKVYLTDLTFRIDSLTQAVLTDWKDRYRDEFVSNSGNGANSSLDMMVNDYLFYYEKYLRAGKIGIPAGVFSGTPLTTHVEAYYSQDFSKALFMEALNASHRFFKGTHFNGTTNGESLSSYLEYLSTLKNDTGLSVLIDEQFDAARAQADNLAPHFGDQIETDNSLMLATFDELQKNVVYMKVDMLQALNINVDYVDADGD